MTETGAARAASDCGSAPAVQIAELDYTYPDGSVALRQVSLTVGRGEKVAVIGANGAGKSTLLLHLNGSLRGAGTVKIFGQAVTRRNLPQIRRRVGLIFQYPDDQLFCPTVGTDVAFGPEHQGLPQEVVAERVAAALQAVGLVGFETRNPFHLSLGEKRRAALATVLAMQPDLLALDEPLSNLDPRGRRRFLALLKQMTQSMLVVTHDLELVRALCQRVYLLTAGQVVYSGPVESVLDDAELLAQNGLV